MSRRIEALYLLAVARNFQPRHHDLLVTQIGSLEGLLDCSEDDLRRLDLKAGHKQRLLEAQHGCDIAGSLAKLTTAGVTMVGWGDELYPELLAELPDAPLLLFCKGDVQMMRHHGVGIVGSRKCSTRGRELAKEFGYQLAELAVPVVSGMALGIDGAAHSGALEVQGPTVAVLGCGVDVIYPPAHHELYEELISKALVISEYPLGTRPDKSHFPQRNRIISGLTKGTIVVEAPMGSGALITAKLATEHQREVFAVPGPVGSPYTRGTHDLIKRGRAKLVENVDDVLVEFGTTRAALRKERTATAKLLLDEPPLTAAEGTSGKASTMKSSVHGLDLSPIEKQVLDALSYEGTHVNGLLRKLEMTTPECIAHLTMLEIKGLVTAAGNGYYTRL